MSPQTEQTATIELQAIARDGWNPSPWASLDLKRLCQLTGSCRDKRSAILMLRWLYVNTPQPLAWEYSHDGRLKRGWIQYSNDAKSCNPCYPLPSCRDRMLFNLSA